MDVENTKEKIKKAEEAVGVLRDEKLRSVAFKLVLRDLLGTTSPEKNTDNTAKASSEAAQTTTHLGKNSPKARVARWLDVEANLVEDIAEFGEDATTLHISEGVLPKKKSDAQVFIAEIKLALDKEGYQRTDVPAREINKLCEKHLLKDSNTATNLKKSNSIVVKGDKGEMKTYQIKHGRLSDIRSSIRKLLGAD